jgi:hypothetical protein
MGVIQNLSDKIKGRNNFGDLSIDGRMLLNYMSRKRVRIWKELFWLKTG